MLLILCFSAGYSSKGKFALEGSSAGGVAAGAVLNRHPSFFAAALLESPFVDVLSTLCDPTLPLTQHEYDEFGHPGSAEGVRHLHSICPYQGIVPGQMYPPVLVTCSQSDHRVPSWGPLKYAARLRAAQGGVGGGAAAGRVLVLPDAHEGHLAGDRERYDVKAAQYAFVLKAMELRDRPEAW